MAAVTGVAQDLGVAGSQPIDATGKPVQRVFRLGMEDVSEKEVLIFAKAARVHGMDQIADRIDSLLGTTTTASFIERHQVLTGVAIGVAASGAGLGAFLLGRKIYRSRQLAKMGGAKVVSMPRR